MDVPGGAWTVYSSDVHSDIPTLILICIWGPGSLELGNLNYKFINLDFK